MENDANDLLIGDKLESEPVPITKKITISEGKKSAPMFGGQIFGFGGADKKQMTKEELIQKQERKRERKIMKELMQKKEWNKIAC